MRTTVLLPDERGETIKALAEAAGISQSEWLRRTIDAACIPGASPAHTSTCPDDTTANTSAYIDAEDRARMEEALRTVNETVTALTAERDALTARVTELEALSRTAAAEIAAVIAESDREHAEHDKIETERDKARAKTHAIAAERDTLAARVRELEEERRAREVKIARVEVLAETAAAERDHARKDAEKAAADAVDRLAEMRHARDLAEGLHAAAVARANGLEAKLMPFLIPETAGPSAGTVEAAASIAVPAGEGAPPRPPGPPMPARRPWPLGWLDEIRRRGPAA